jgi:rhodanese-related sulfurtransferase
LSLGSRLRTWIPLGEVPEVAPRVLAERLAAGDDVQLVDVRSALEHRQSRIAGARCAPILAWPSALTALRLDPARPVVAICLSAHRSIPAVRMLKERGFEAAQLAGGMAAWWAAKLPTAHGNDKPV